MKSLMKNIGNLVDLFVPCTTEIEYDSKYEPEYLDIRFYETSYAMVYKIREILSNMGFVKENVNEMYLEIPHEDEVRYGYSGISFVRIGLELNPKIANNDSPSLLMQDNEIINEVWEN